jgi:molybdenum cofactor cytidylyltransferase
MNLPLLSVLIPAAGASTRLGATKQLLKYRGKSLLQNAVNAANAIDPEEIIVVTGANFEAVQAAVHHPTVHWIHNAWWSSGMGHSIALGAAALSPSSTGLMVLLCDQWRIQPKDLQTLLQIWRANPQRIVVAEVAGVCMPPVIFPASCFEQLQNLSGDQGARSIIDAHPELVIPIPMKNAAFDLDTKEQLEAMEKQTDTAFKKPHDDQSPD